jgi:hypothetical protein
MLLIEPGSQKQYLHIQVGNGCARNSPRSLFYQTWWQQGHNHYPLNNPGTCVYYFPHLYTIPAKSKVRTPVISTKLKR